MEEKEIGKCKKCGHQTFLVTCEGKTLERCGDSDCDFLDEGLPPTLGINVGEEIKAGDKMI